MTASVLALLLAGALVVAAVGGPWVLTRAAPALAAIPRLAAAALALTALLWVAALLALGPLIAWISAGPAWLPKQAAEVCGRCLSAASPFGESAMLLGIPAVVPLALPALGLGAVLVGLVGGLAGLRRAQTAFGAEILAGSEPITLLGRGARVLPDAGLHAFSLPKRHGGIVVSRGTLATLGPDELAAVLAHEQAHLDQRHHLMLAILNGATRFFRAVPLVGAVRAAVPHYLEIAADHAAQDATSTAALAGALLKLGQPDAPQAATSAGRGVAGNVVLHAAGSERIRHLVGVPRPRASAALAAAAGVYAFVFAAVIAAVNLPYVVAVVTGC